MDACSICGAAHAPAAAGEPCLAGCVRSLAGRLAVLEPTVRGERFTIDPDSTSSTVSLGGSAGGAGGMK